MNLPKKTKLAQSKIYQIFKNDPWESYTVIGFRKILVASVLTILASLAVFANIPHAYPVNQQAVYGTILIGLLILFANLKLLTLNKYPLTALIPVLVLTMLLVAAIVHFTGSTQSPFFFLYYLPIIAAGWRYNPNIVFVPAIIGILTVSFEWLFLAYTAINVSPTSFDEFLRESPYPAVFLRSLTIAFVATFVYFLARLRNESKRRLVKTIYALRGKTRELENERSKSQSLATTLTNIGDGVFAVDNNKKVLSWNRAMEKFTGIASNDIIGKNIYKIVSIFDQNDKEICTCASKKCRRTDNLYQQKKLILHKSSQIYIQKTAKNIHVNHISAPLFDNRNRLFASLQIIINIEQYKQLSNISKMAQVITPISSVAEVVENILPRIAQNLNSHKVLICICQKNKPLFIKLYGYNSRQIDKLTNYLKTQILGGQDLKLNFQKPVIGNRSNLNQIYDHNFVKTLTINNFMQLPLVVRNEVFGFLIVIGKKLGNFEKKDFNHFKTLTNYVARIIENAIIYHDLSESLERERQFIADIAHEIKTPLTAVKSEVELAIDRKHPISYYQHVLESILSSVNLLSSRFKNILDLTWSQTSQDKDIPSVDITQVVLDVKEIAEKLAAAKKIQVQSKISAKAQIAADKDRLAQALLNIIDNAIKYTPTGGKVNLSVGKVNGNVKISISDTGIGIPKSELPRIFDRFYRGLKHDRRLGSGLGLAITKSIVSSYKGRIEAVSRVGKGTKFQITFPQVKS